VGGVPLSKLLSPAQIEAVVNRAKRGGAEIVDLLKTGSAFNAPAAATLEMVDAILRDEKRVIPCCTLLQGQYGVNDAYVGAPVTLGAGGVEAIHEIPLADDELAAMKVAGDAVLELVAATPAG
jgi:malate dehydrogenase